MTDTTAEAAAPSASAAIKQVLAAEAQALGFNRIGFAATGRERRHEDNLARYLAAGYHGDMAWMENARRTSPAELWPEAQSAIVLGINYGPEDDPREILSRPEAGAISVYAQGRDYHDVVKKRLKRMARAIAETYQVEVKVFVDTAPLMEKPLAQKAGLGWQGKHTNLVSREFGSWLFLGEILTTLPIEPDVETRDHCGQCRRCLDICPTNAFPNAYELDARRCISYLTIEHKGHIDIEFRTAIGNRIYGCDDCLAVCPWNKFAQISREAAFAPREALRAPRLARLAALEDAEFRELFSGSPIKRIGRDRFVRNVLIALGNSGEASLAAAARQRLGDASPLVRAMAVWALSKLLTPSEFEDCRSRREASEPDDAVRAEWRRPDQSTP